MSRRILIADDEKGIRAALGQLLEYEGYEVRSVGNAVDAQGVGQGAGNSNNIVNGWRTGPGPEFIKGEPIDFMANTLNPGALWYKLVGYPNATHAGIAAQAPLISTIQATNGGAAATGYAETPSASATYSTNGVGVTCDLF